MTAVCAAMALILHSGPATLPDGRRRSLDASPLRRSPSPQRLRRHAPPSRTSAARSASMRDAPLERARSNAWLRRAVQEVFTPLEGGHKWASAQDLKTISPAHCLQFRMTRAGGLCLDETVHAPDHRRDAVPLSSLATRPRSCSRATRPSRVPWPSATPGSRGHSQIRSGCSSRSPRSRTTRPRAPPRGPMPAPTSRPTAASNSTSPASLEAAARQGLPLTVVDLPGRDSRELYGADMALIRPDQIVAWREGDGLDATRTLARLCGVATPDKRPTYPWLVESLAVRRHRRAHFTAVGIRVV